MRNSILVQLLFQPLYARGGLRSVQHAPAADSELLVIGDVALLGALQGKLALEICPQGMRLWTMYSVGGALVPYARLCAEPPANAPATHAATFWVNPDDDLVKCAGLGNEWLLPSQIGRRQGLDAMRLNTLMLDAATYQRFGKIETGQNSRFADSQPVEADELYESPRALAFG